MVLLGHVELAPLGPLQEGVNEYMGGDDFCSWNIQRTLSLCAHGHAPKTTPKEIVSEFISAV